MTEGLHRQMLAAIRAEMGEEFGRELREHSDDRLLADDESPGVAGTQRDQTMQHHIDRLRVLATRHLRGEWR